MGLRHFSYQDGESQEMLLTHLLTPETHPLPSVANFLLKQYGNSKDLIINHVQLCQGV